MSCVFCDLIAQDDERLDEVTSEWVTFQPIGPINEGHALIVPVRHVERFEMLDLAEVKTLPAALNAARYRYGGMQYNLGINAGEAAGQTVFHLHIHLIPRTVGDVVDPKGGIIGALGEKLDGSQMTDYLESI